MRLPDAEESLDARSLGAAARKAFALLSAHRRVASIVQAGKRRTLFPRVAVIAEWFLRFAHALIYTESESMEVCQ